MRTKALEPYSGYASNRPKTAFIRLDNGSFFVELDLTGDILNQIEEGIKDFDPRFGRCDSCNAFTKFLTDASKTCSFCDPGTMLCEDCSNAHKPGEI